jgi:transcriptional regulator GlxA family with amidase domain
VDWIADEVGFGTAAMLRHHFTKARSVSPQRYRRTFSAFGPADTEKVG